MEENTNITETIEEGQSKTYTQEEVDALLQQEGDRRVSQAQKKWAEKNAQQVREAEKLARMNEQEKYEYQLQQREEAIASKEKELLLAENKNEASKILAERGLSLSLVDFVVADDADTMSNNINILTKAFQQSVKAEVEKRLSSKAPRQNLPLDKTIEKSDFVKMTSTQLMQLKRDNPDLYNSLKN